MDRANEVMERATARQGMDRAAGVNQLPRLSPKCVDCGHEIPAARLAAVPDTKRCTPCQKDYEFIKGRQG